METEPFMNFEFMPILALPGPVITSVAAVSIAMAVAVCLLGIRRREAGHDPMLIVSAVVVVVLAVAILATR